MKAENEGIQSNHSGDNNALLGEVKANQESQAGVR
jgi:hypothetical protein